MMKSNETAASAVEPRLPPFYALGLDRAEARVMAFMHLFAPYTTQGEIEEGLGAARSAISQALKNLERFGYLSKVRKGKTYIYTLDLSAPQLMLRIMEKCRGLGDPPLREMALRRAMSRSLHPGAREALERRMRETLRVSGLITEFERRLA